MGLSLGRGIALVASFIYSYITSDWQVFIAVSSSAHQSRIAKRDRRRAISAYNASLKDRLEMVDLTPDAPRTLVMGRVRAVEGVRRPPWTSGANAEKLTMVVSFAGHEIDGFEQWYLNDDLVTLDVDGWVQPTSVGTASGYTTTAAGFAVGTTAIPLITGAGSIATGDTVLFDGDSTRYQVAAGIGAPGTVVLAAPGLLKPLAASAIAVKLYQHPYVKARGESAIDHGTLDEAGAATVALSHEPIGGAAWAVWSTGYGEYMEQGAASVSVVGTTATVTGGLAGADIWVNYQYTAATSLVRIRPYLGTISQNVGADLAAEYPGKLTATDRFAGIALAAVDVLFDTDVFTQGRPTVTAVFRGAKLYDARLDSTVAGGSGSHRIDYPDTWTWSENAALQADHYARWSGGWALPAAEIPRADVMAAADACDVSTEFTLRKADDSTETVTLPRYTCGITIPADADPNTRRAAMDAIMAAMAGSDGWDGGLWRFRAGVKAASTFTLTTAWLAQKLGRDGKPGNDPVLRGANAFSRDQRINRITGSCVDPAQRYQVLPYPGVSDETLIAAHGVRAEQVTYEGVNHIAQAQHLASIAIREAQAGTRIEAMCNLYAYQARLFDVGTLLLPRQGMDEALGKTAEVIGRRWSPNGGIKLQLAEITDAIYEPLPELVGRDPAPDSNLRRPWDVEQLTGLAVADGVAIVLADGTVQTMTAVSWTAAVGANIRQGGEIEVQYTEAAAATPAGDWPAWREQGAATSALIGGLLAGRYYMFRHRAVQTLPYVRGPWGGTVLYQIGGKLAPPGNVLGYRMRFYAGGVQFTWDSPVDLDYGSTELHVEGAWSDDTAPIFKGKVRDFLWPWPPDGTYTILAKHVDTSGNWSVDAAIAQFTIAGTIVTEFTAYWYTDDGTPATWYADIEDPESGEVIGTTPAYWVSDGPIDIAVLTEHIGDEAATAKGYTSIEYQATTYLTATDVVTDTDLDEFRFPFLDAPALTYVNDTAGDVEVELSYHGNRSLALSSDWTQDVRLSAYVQVDDVTASTTLLRVSAYGPNQAPLVTPADPDFAADGVETCLQSFSVPAGHTVTMAYYGWISLGDGTGPGTSATETTNGFLLRFAALKR